MERAQPHTPGSLAAELRVSKKLIYRLANERVLPSFRLGRLLRFDPDAVAEFVRNGGVPQSTKTSRRAK